MNLIRKILARKLPGWNKLIFSELQNEFGYPLEVMKIRKDIYDRERL
jgi:hypothetical protein